MILVSAEAVKNTRIATVKTIEKTTDHNTR